jgi:tetratricopeptide (TPR) repeat protein
VPPLDDVRSSVGQARRSGDARALAEALSMCHHAMLSRAPLPECLQVAEELIDVASEADLGVLALMGLCWRTVDLFQLADPRATRALEDLRQRADALAIRSILYIIEVLGVMLLLRAGQLDDALARAVQAYELGTAVGDIDAFAYLGAQTVAIRWMQGREAELLDVVEEAASSPTLIQLEFAFRAAAAHVAARAGLLERARTTLDTLAGAGLAALPRSSTWQTGMTAIVEVAAALGDGEIARQAYELLEPLAGLPTLASVGILCLGSTERPLGLAAMTYGDLDRAAGHLERAVNANRHLANRPMTAVALADLAEVLRRRGRPTAGGPRSRSTRPSPKPAGWA